jgi:Zn-dependent protease with chaperone function
MQKYLNRFVPILTIACVTILAGCAAPTTRPTVGTQTQIDSEVVFQRQMAVQQRLEQDLRLNRIYARMRTAAIEFCPKAIGPSVGAYFFDATNKDVSSDFRTQYSLVAGQALVDIIPDSPAQKAGFQLGDQMISFNGVPVTTAEEFKKAVDAMEVGKPVQVGYMRSGESKTATMTPIAACNYPISIDHQSHAINAYADGKSIVITAGMMNFARADEELALVVAHEMAHNTMAHMEAKQTNRLGGLFADLALTVLTKGAYRDTSISNIAGRAYSKEFESEADYVGLYIMAKSGYKIDDAPKFWRSMAIAHPGNIKSNHTASHPSTAARMVALDAAVIEIRQKQIANEALTPNLKGAKLVTKE